MKKARTRLPPVVRGLVISGYVLTVGLLGLAILEAAARWVGLGDPIVYYNDAWGGMRPLPGQQSERLGGARVTVDANGFRTAVPPTAGAVRILYIGDSVTWGGSSVDDREVFSEVAADVLRRAKPVYAMNAGVNATGPLNHAEVFRNTLATDSVDAVVWLFPWGDMGRSFATVSYLWPPTAKPRAALVEFVDHLILRFWLPSFRVGTSQVQDFAPGPVAGYETLFESTIHERQQRNAAAVRSVVSEAGERSTPLILGITPYRAEGALEPLPEEASALLHELAAAGAIIFDVAEALQSAGVPVPDLFLDRVHFTAAGHRAVGDALGRALAQHLGIESGTRARDTPH